MREDGKLDYLELPAGALGAVKAFYAAAFGWTFQDYGPTYAAFERGAGRRLRRRRRAAPSPCPSSTPTTWRPCWPRSRRRAADIVKPIFAFPGGRRFHFRDPSGNELAVWSET